MRCLMLFSKFAFSSASGVTGSHISMSCDTFLSFSCHITLITRWEPLNAVNLPTVHSNELCLQWYNPFDLWFWEQNISRTTSFLHHASFLALRSNFSLWFFYFSGFSDQFFVRRDIKMCRRQGGLVVLGQKCTVDNCWGPIPRSTLSTPTQQVA